MTEISPGPESLKERISRPSAHGLGPIALGAAVAGLTLVVYQWVLFAVGISLRMFYPLAALFVAQAVFNGVVLASCLGEIQLVGNGAGDFRPRTGRRLVSVVLVGALLAMSGVLPLMFAKFGGEKVSELALALAIGGLMAAAVLMIAVAPMLCVLAAWRAKDPPASR